MPASPLTRQAPTEALPPHPELRDYYDGGKKPFVNQIFNEGAADYDRVERMMALGTGSWYRRQALTRAGLVRGMKALDVAVGTGLVAEEAVALTGDARLVIGVDPSEGMIAEARRKLTINVLRGTGERLPIADESFDFISMGYALRHLSDLRSAFSEFHRVLKPGGKLCVLEITRPRGRVARLLLRTYMRGVVPWLTRWRSRGVDSSILWRYYWDTIETCVAPARIVDALTSIGFENVQQHTEMGIFSEYTATRRK
jgi:demethylmenaquinone methyltransferase/2-methoxy-6-polyprenyl-1,4-benzoquinol methylase